MNNSQVVIYLDDPDGQLMQVSYHEYKNYWSGLGWRILTKAPELAGMETTTRLQSILF